MAITKVQFKAANARGAAAIARGPIAHAARYDSRRKLIVIALEGGCEFAFPADLAEGLTDMPRSKLAKIQISPNGHGLHWPLLDADLYVPSLIEGAFGSRRWMEQIGKLGVQAVVRSRPRPLVRTVGEAVAQRRELLLSAMPFSALYPFNA